MIKIEDIRKLEEWIAKENKWEGAKADIDPDGWGIHGITISSARLIVHETINGSRNEDNVELVALIPDSSKNEVRATRIKHIYDESHPERSRTYELDYNGKYNIA